MDQPYVNGVCHKVIWVDFTFLDAACRKPVIRFRNYKPSDPGLVTSGVAVVIPQPELPSAAVKEREGAELTRLLAAPVRSLRSAQY